MEKFKIEHLRIAMNMADIPVNEAAVETFLLCLELVKKKGGKGTLKDSCKIKSKVEEKYKGTPVIHPHVIVENIKFEKNKVIEDQRFLLKRKNERLNDVAQLTSILIEKDNLRPRVVKKIYENIINICTE